MKNSQMKKVKALDPKENHHKTLGKEIKDKQEKLNQIGKREYEKT